MVGIELFLLLLQFAYAFLALVGVAALALYISAPVSIQRIGRQLLWTRLCLLWDKWTGPGPT